MNEKSCNTCLYQNDNGDCVAELCSSDYGGWRSRVGQPITFVAKIKAALPKEEKFSLDKLIDDHWKYVEDMLRVHGTEEEAIAIVGFHYKSAFRHGYKHCLERHNIVEE